MKTITKEIKLFTVKELSEQAKTKAHETWRSHNDYAMLEECMLDNLMWQLEKLKITSDNPKVGCSLGYSQGDGAMFCGDYKWKKYTVAIKHSGRYYHSNSKEIDITTEDGEYADDKVYAQFEKIYQKICAELEEYGYDFIETEDSLYNFEEECEANDYTFLEDGTQYYE